MHFYKTGSNTAKTTRINNNKPQITFLKNLQ